MELSLNPAERAIKSAVNRQNKATFSSPDYNIAKKDPNEQADD